MKVDLNDRDASLILNLLVEHAHKCFGYMKLLDDTDAGLTITHLYGSAEDTVTVCDRLIGQLRDKRTDPA